MRSALDHRLTDEAKKELTQIAITRIGELRSARDSGEFARRRETAELMLEGEFDFRRSENPEDRRTIFDNENVSAQLPRSAWRFIYARLSKDFFGSEPWLSAVPEGVLDASIASKIQKHAPWKLRQSNWKPSIKGALGVAMALGECAIKTTYRVDDDFSERVEMILCDPSGEPVVTQDGEYIYDTDESEETQEEVEGIGTAPVIRFAKDPQIAMVDGMQWKEHLIEEKVRLYSNVDTRPIYWKDFVWNMECDSIEESADRDLIAHSYSATPLELLAKYDPDGDNTAVQEIIQKLRYPSCEKPEAEKAREANRESEVPYSNEVTKVKVTEVFTRRDVMGKGTASRIFMVLIEETQDLLWIDYVANISPRAQWPITMATVNRVNGRAYGRGIFEIYEMAADLLDRCISAVVARNKQNSNPTKIWNPHLTKEGADGDNEDLEFDPNKTYTCKDETVKASDILQYVGMPDLDERTWDLVEFFMQLIQVESGVTNANQGDLSSLPSNTTATGVNSMLESSSVLHWILLDDFRDSLEPALQYAIELIYFRQEADEVYEYFEGNASEIMALADARQLRQMPINVRLLFQRAKRMELRQAALEAIPKVQEFFTILMGNPMAAKKMRPLFVQALRSMEIDNIDEILPMDDEIDAIMAPPQPPVEASGPTEAVPADEPAVAA